MPRGSDRLRGGINVSFNVNSEVQPDVTVVRAEDEVGVRLLKPLVLAAEIFSLDSVLRDLNPKNAVYERFGVQTFDAVRPFPARVTPAKLIEKLRRR